MTEQRKLLHYAIFAALVLALLVISVQRSERELAGEMPYSAFKQQLADGNIHAVICEATRSSPI